MTDFSKSELLRNRQWLRLRVSHAAFAIASALLLIVSGHAGAQEEVAEEEEPEAATELQMEVEVGFGSYVRQGCYFPVRVTIENAGHSRRGRIRVVSQDPGRPLSALFVAECDIPENSRKTYCLYPYFLEFDPSPTLYIQYAERVPILTKEVDLKFLRDEERLWVEVADEGPDFTFLSGLSLWENSSFAELARFATQQQAQMGGRYGYGQPQQPVVYNEQHPRMVGTKPQDLPDRPEGYETVEGLVLNSRRFYELSEEQQAALADWVISGGSVIIWLGDDPMRYQGTFVTGAVDGSGRLGPSAFSEPPVRTTLGSLKALPGFLGQRDVIGSFPVSYAPQASARVLLAEDGTPVLQHLKLGRGNILLSGLDLAALQSSSVGRLDRYFSFMMGYLASVDNRVGKLAKYDPNAVNTYTFTPERGQNPFVSGSIYRTWYMFNNVLQSSNLTALPPLQAIALFLAAYVILIGPINYYILLRLRHREWLWYTIPVLVAAFCFLSYTWALGTKGSRLLLTRINIEDAFPDQGAGWQDSVFSLFSPAARRYDVSLAESRGLIRELEVPRVEQGFSGLRQPSAAIDEADRGDALTLVQDGPKRDAYADNAYIRIWSEEHFESQGAIPFNSQLVLENVILRNNHLRGTLRVSLDFDLYGPFVVYVSRGGMTTQSLRLDDSSPIREGSFDFDLFMDLRSKIAPVLVHQVSCPSMKSRDLREACLDAVSERPPGGFAESELILAGWRTGSGSRPLRSPRTRSITEESLVLIHLPLEIGQGDFLVESAQGAILGIDAGKAEVSTTGELLRLTDGQMTYSISFPPVRLADHKPKSLEVNISVGADAGPIRVYAFDHYDSVWAPLPRTGEHYQRITYGLSGLDRYLAPDDRTVFFVIEGDPATGEDVISLSGVTVNTS